MRDALWRLMVGSHEAGSLKNLDVVETVVDSGRWPAGTVGTVIETDDPSAVLIEISDEHGHSLDFASLPRRALRLVSHT